MIIGYFWTQIQTTIHKFWICYYTFKYCIKADSPLSIKLKLIINSITHDLSKYGWKEAQGFAKTIFKLKKTNYGSEEYKDLLKQIEPCLNHHYCRNDHHPEYYDNGTKDMSELKKTEMIIDWKSATRRHKTGCIYKSLEINQKRFNYSDEEKEKFKKIVDIIN